MKKQIIYVMLFGLLSLTACNKWLDVKPADKVLGDELFSSQKGYLSALNGVYVEMVSPTLYGANLTAGMVDVMAQYYRVMGNSNHSHRLFANYEYADAASKAIIESIWVKNYTLLYNINTLIEQTTSEQKVLSQSIRNIILGEAYALRAILHFDLLRLFGPIYSTEASTPSIPYQTATDFTIEPLLPANEVISKITADLEQALEHLDSDPVLAQGATYLPGEDGSIDFSYRQYRLNYLAAKALLARVEMWAGNSSEAYRLAKEVINQCHGASEKLFQFTPGEEVTSPTLPDRFFSTEVLFGLYSSKRSDIHNNYFASALNMNNILTMLTQRIDTTFDDDNDFRKKFWGKESINSEEVNVFLKYADVTATDETFQVKSRYLIPMIRISEMYLIAAECTTDPEEANTLVNSLRNARNCISIAFDMGNRKNVIASEYLREFLGEGQMFYYYKRNAYQNLPNGGDPQVTFNMDLSKYILPLPDSEISQRN